MSNSSSRNLYTQKPPVGTQSQRYSSSDTSSSRSSTGTHNSTSRLTMSEGGAREEKLRTGDNDGHYIIVKKNNGVQVINHRVKTYDSLAPLASFASSEDYNHTQGRERHREQERTRREKEQQRDRK
ncbi:uncharacterized protein RCO7_03816 [Rhynchosporium graminicola]|uniref:Uncharacterized protein n=1 Tax=Rhynchosporium graminicola TaxID=2792576 RepID=A0A1E1LM30_9HELO|nr:uncharacterized protein RCO7_03816 [Rhynchosporium commune]